MQVDHYRRDEIENWDKYFEDVKEAVEKCIADNNIDRKYAIIDQQDWIGYHCYNENFSHPL